MEGFPEAFPNEERIPKPPERKSLAGEETAKGPAAKWQEKQIVHFLCGESPSQNNLFRARGRRRFVTLRAWWRPCGERRTPRRHGEIRRVSLAECRPAPFGTTVPLPPWQPKHTSGPEWMGWPFASRFSRCGEVGRETCHGNDARAASHVGGVSRAQPRGRNPDRFPPRFPSLTPVKTTAASKLRRRGKLAPLPVFSDVTAARGKEFTCCCNMSSLRKAFCLGVYLSAWMMTTAGKESRAPEHFARALFSRPTSVFSRGSDSHSFLESAPHK